MELLFDPMFRVPFVTGVVLAPLAALLGCYLRLREEWLGALAYTQVAAAGGVFAVVLHLPLLPGALAAAGLLALIKGASGRVGNDHFALAFLVGWGVMLILAGFTAHGTHVSAALLDGQLYFSGVSHLAAAGLVAAVAVLLMPWLSRRVLTARFFPDHFSANKRTAWHFHLLFDLLAVATLAVTTTSFGVMAAFALVFVPSWIAWRVAVGWRQVLGIAMAVATVAYVLAFALAMLTDQPFGPVLVVLLGFLASARLFPRR